MSKKKKIIISFIVLLCCCTALLLVWQKSKIEGEVAENRTLNTGVLKGVDGRKFYE